ncbi:MAG: VWA domain-containing protein [Erysipelotrichaceae bacterium]|nr:VWA domain-containing protein [Erysipelotrichaceae bacterium]
MKDNVRVIIRTVVSIIVVAALVVVGIRLTGSSKDGSKDRAYNAAAKKVRKMVKSIDPDTADLISSALEYDSKADDASELPDLDKSSISVAHATDTYAEIYCSPEKAESGTDGWMSDMAKDFNAAGYTINGKKISVQVRDVTSGLAMDYIRTGKYSPAGFSPSNDMWVKMLEAYGVKTTTIADKLVGNTAVIVMKNNTYKDFVKQHGDMDLKALVEAVENGEFVMGYTNPFTSSTGLNFLISVLQRYDEKHPLSDEAIERFTAFQKNIPFVSLSTVQMRNAADKGTLDGFVLEYQLYINDSTLSKNYTAVPFGYRHDNPLVAVKGASSEEKEILEKFAEYCQSDKGTKLAKKYGFNQQEDYKGLSNDLSGDTLVSAQSVYKTVKDAGQEVIGVFVADVSGSMNWAPLASLQKSLINSINYISSDNYIGLVTYNDEVTINVPIQKFDMRQKSYFKGAVSHMKAVGGTATYDALLTGTSMILDAMEEHPDAKPILFVLSDGETNRGYSFDEIEGVVADLRIPVYTINYNQWDAKSLQDLAAINEAACINASSDDVVYKLKNLLNAEM